MPKTWVVVAESSRAKIFELDKKNSPLKELQGLAHTCSRIHEKKLTSTLSGWVPEKHKLTSRTSIKQHESQVFARTIGKHLDNAYNRGKFSKLIIMSSPGFLGQLRKQIGTQIHKQIITAIDKNLVRHNTTDIQAHLPYSF
ncbi:MAG: host attachment protein [Gammaproteobacteria bacterium]|nr:host attachment protein [Gammaproteobacteria bacterium]